jgi:N-methylhydantoinase A
VFSAFGAATADIIHSRVLTYQGTMPIDPGALNERLDAIEQELRTVMRGENFGPEQVEFRRFVSMRFRRQTYGVELALPWERMDVARVAELARLFEAKYGDLYGQGAGFAEAGMEINTLRVDAVGTVPKPTLTSEPATTVDTSRAIKGTRAAYFGGQFVETAIYDFERMAVGTLVSGPAIVEAPLTTIVVPPEYLASVDGYHNLIISSDPTRVRV